MPTIEQVAALKKVLQLGPDFDGALEAEYEMRAAPADRFDVLTHRTVTAGRHPCEKPVPLMQDLLASTDTRAVILDPFMGSGSTGVAAIKEGRPFIGIERDEKYFEIARQRIAEAASQPDLFIAKPEPVERPTFAEIWDRPFREAAE